MKNNVITKSRLIEDLKKIGVKEGDLLNLKISLKSIGYVDGGAKTVIKALLEVVGEKGTIVTESFVRAYPVIALKFKKRFTDNDTKSYAGKIANEILRFDKCLRSTHPIQKFAAIGFYAEKLMREHVPTSYAYDVLRVMSEIGGKNLRIGDLDKVVGVGTTHVAIGSVGIDQKRIKYGVYYKNEHGKSERFLVNWAGGCSKGFNKLMDVYRKNNAIIGESKIGNSPSILSVMRKTVDIEIEELTRDSSFFMCDDPSCVNCQLSWRFSKGSLIKVIKENIIKRDYKNIIKAILIFFNTNYQPLKK